MEVKKIGLVLAGGGGRGSYQLGFWKALKEMGLDKYIACVSGTSVGALNATLFSQGNYSLAEEIWLNLNKNIILDNNHTKKTININGIFRGETGLFSKDGIRNLIKDNIDFKQLRIPTYATITSIDDSIPFLRSMQAIFNNVLRKKFGLVEYKLLNDLCDEDAIKVLLATSAIPMIYYGEQIGDKLYFDGGFADNVPIEPLYAKEECDLIIVVHLYKSNIIDLNNYPNTKIIEIYPSINLGGILSFNYGDIQNRFNQGVIDTKRILEPIVKSVQNKIYEGKVLDTLLINDDDVNNKEIIHHKEIKTYPQELIEDTLSIITAFSSKLYGRSSQKTKKIKEDIIKFIKSKE